MSIRKTRVTKRLVTFLAVGAVAITVAGHAVADPTVIGVDGTKVYPLPIDFLPSVLDFNNGAFKNLAGYKTVIADYPRSFGIGTLGGPNYDDSVAIGKEATIDQIVQAQHGDKTIPVKVVCLSQGSDVCTQANDQLWSTGYDQSNVTYWLLGNVRNAEGGLKVWIPRIGDKGIFVPGLGVTVGNATPTTGSDAHIFEVLYEYDFFARTPLYVNPLSFLNAGAGALLEHGNYGQADPYASDNIVRTTPDGKITNIMIPVKEVPLLTLAKYVGMPQPVADILNPALKAIIDTGYDPVTAGPGTYPTEAVRFKALPSNEKFQEDVKNVQQGFAESWDKLVATLEPANPAPSTPSAPNVSSDPSSSSTVTQNVTVNEQPEREQPKTNPPALSKPKPKSKPSPMTTGNLFRPTTLARGANSDPAKQAGITLSAIQNAVNNTVTNAVNTITKVVNRQGSKHDVGPASSSSSSSTGDSDGSS